MGHHWLFHAISWDLPWALARAFAIQKLIGHETPRGEARSQRVININPTH
jgi:hypothetical protein